MAQNPWELPDGFDESVKEAVKAIFKAFANAKKMIPKSAIDALKSGNIDQFMSMIDWAGVDNQFNPFKEILADTAKKAGIQVFRRGNVATRLAFDIVDERAVNYAQWHGSQLVVEISEGIRQNIRDVIARSTAGDMTWNEVSETIYRFIPLTSRDAKAVQSYQDRQYNRFLKKGVNAETAKKRAKALADKYSDKLTVTRANTIARTEIANAAMEGSYLGWEAGVEEGLIDGQARKEWIAEPDACEICHEMDGKTVQWDDAFEFGGLMPPAHPNCRCSTALMPAMFVDSPWTRQATQKSLVNVFEVELAKHLAGKHNQFDHAPHRAGYKGNIDKVKTPLDRMTNLKANAHQFALEMVKAGYKSDMSFADFYANDKLKDIEQSRNEWIEKQWDKLGFNKSDRMLGAPQSNRDPNYVRMERLVSQTVMDEVHRIQQERLGKIDDVSPKTWNDAQKNLFALSGEVEPSLQVDVKKLGAILNSGEFKNQYETRRSGGTYDPSMRMSYENVAFGYTGDTELSDRPKYGYLAGQGAMTVGSSTNVLSYGGVRFVLKPETMERATLTLADSLRSPQNIPVKGFKFDTRGVFTPDMYSLSKANTKEKRAEFLVKRKSGLWNSPEYVETQFHGKVTFDDVARIEIFDHPLVSGAISKTAMNKLGKLGIPVQMIPVSADESKTLDGYFASDDS